MVGSYCWGWILTRVILSWLLHQTQHSHRWDTAPMHCSPTSNDPYFCYIVTQHNQKINLLATNCALIPYVFQSFPRFLFVLLPCKSLSQFAEILPWSICFSVRSALSKVLLVSQQTGFNWTNVSSNFYVLSIRRTFKEDVIMKSFLYSHGDDLVQSITQDQL